MRLVDIARAAGVSRPVAGKVLLGSGGNIRVSEAAAQRIREAAARLGYRPNAVARQLAGARSKLLGILMSGQDNQATVQRLFAIEREAHRRGYRCVIGQIHGEESDLTEHLQDFEDRGVDAILHLDTAAEDVAQRLLNTPRTVFAIRPALAGAHYVELDRAQASRLAVRHLHERGCTRCALILSRLENHAALERRRGFVEACTELGMQGTPLVWLPEDPTADLLGNATAAVQVVVQQQGCRGLVAGNDHWGVALIKAAHRLGLHVPRDVAVVGFNNLDITTAVEPELTTIDQQHEELAPAVLSMLLRLIEQGPLPPRRRGVTIPPRLVVRAST